MGFPVDLSCFVGILEKRVGSALAEPSGTRQSAAHRTAARGVARCPLINLGWAPWSVALLLARQALCGPRPPGTKPCAKPGSARLRPAVSLQAALIDSGPGRHRPPPAATPHHSSIGNGLRRTQACGGQAGRQAGRLDSVWTVD